MTLLLQYNVNNNILDGAHYIWWPIVFPGGAFVSVLSKDLQTFKPPMGNSGYTPDCMAFSPVMLLLPYSSI